VNASAQRQGSTYVINMYGGLARHETMTQDGFFVVACHELGHQIGGAPKVSGWFNNWASNEGQSDYFSTFKCFRKLYSAEENAEFVANTEIDAVVTERCEAVFETIEDINTCKRGSMAGAVVARFFQVARKEDRVPSFSEPDTKVVSKTDDRHPDTQCRMDTYFAGAVCGISLDESMSPDDPNLGTCNRKNNDENGIRPLCWYKPTVSTGNPDPGEPNKCPIPIPGFCDENGNPKFPIPGAFY
jgi:hypothetical protein